MINDFLGRNLLFFSDRIDLTMSFKYIKTILDEKDVFHDTNIFNLSNIFLFCNFLFKIFSLYAYFIKKFLVL